MFYELQATFDSRKSFYGKAKINEQDGVKTLISYDTEICTQHQNGEIYFYKDVIASQTTLRHVKEFLRQTFGCISYPDTLIEKNKKNGKNFMQIYKFLQGKTLKAECVIE